jgi:hypothetical protein
MHDVVLKKLGSLGKPRRRAVEAAWVAVIFAVFVLMIMMVLI